MNFMAEQVRALTDLFALIAEQGYMLTRQGVTPTSKVSLLTADSREVSPGALFVAVKGSTQDGHQYVPAAIEQGARAVVAEHIAPEWVAQYPGVSFAQVTDSRKVLAVLAAAFYGYPAREMLLIGITGTNGKTTTAYLVHHLLSSRGEKVGLLGTVMYQVGNQRYPSTHTTPDAVALHRMLRMMRDVGCTSCVMEVSSHALAQDRVHGLAFDVAVFTNLTQDHLDYHRSFEAYFHAKRRLFEALSPRGFGWFNADDPWGKQMVAGIDRCVIGYGLGEEACLRGEILENSLRGLVLRVEGRTGHFPLVGRFNAYNLLAAYGVGKVLGMEGWEILHQLEQAPAVPGRFEQVRLEGVEGPQVIVDYAHTPDALENVLATIRGTGVHAEQLWCVFGCGGDRDPQKRSMMGAVAESLAGKVVVTSDNPRTESPEQIIAHILAGMKWPDRVVVLPDRREAIQYAIQHAAPSDTILIAGKGHETYQIIGTQQIAFDDREEARRALSQRCTTNHLGEQV